MTYPTFSIIIPSFNQAAYLRELLESIKRQSYSGLEVIVIDGGSTDSTVDVLNEYNDFIYFWESVKDDGQVFAINRGLSLATSEWVCWQNSDDLFSHEDFFSHFADLITKYPNIDVYYADINLVNSFSRILRSIRYCPISYSRLYFEGMVISNQASIWRRSLHQDVGLLDTSYNYCFDFEWFLRLSSVRAKFMHVSKIYASFRIHADSKTANFTRLFRKEMAQIRSTYTKPLQFIPTAFIKIYFKASKLFYLIRIKELSYIFQSLSSANKITH